MQKMTLANALLVQGRVKFRGQDEKISSNNRGNFLEAIELTKKLISWFSVKLDKLQKKRIWKSSGIQKDMKKEIRIRSNEIMIDKEIGTSKKSIFVDESSDILHTEWTTFVLKHERQSDVEIIESASGSIKLKHSSAETLTKSMLNFLVASNLDTQDTRVQGHDGASNMLGYLARLSTLAKTLTLLMITLIA